VHLKHEWRTELESFRSASNQKMISFWTNSWRVLMKTGISRKNLFLSYNIVELLWSHVKPKYELYLFFFFFLHVLAKTTGKCRGYFFFLLLLHVRDWPWLVINSSSQNNGLHIINLFSFFLLKRSFSVYI
jgi:hypothetical protein